MTRRNRAHAYAGMLGAVTLLCAAPTLVLARDEAADTLTTSTSGAIWSSTMHAGTAAVDRAKSVGEKADERHHGRPFTTPPGHRDGSARDAAPGHVRRQALPPAGSVSQPQPTGEVLGATPASVRSPRMAHAPGRSDTFDAGARVLPGLRGSALPAMSNAITNGPRSAVAFGGAVGVSAAHVPAFGELATPRTQNALAAALVLLVLGAQAIAGALLLSAARDMLGAVGPARLP